MSATDERSGIEIDPERVAGWLTEEIEIFGVNPTSRGRRMDEMLAVITDLWHDGWAEHHGEHFDVPRVGMFPVPSPPPPRCPPRRVARARRPRSCG